MYGNGVENDPLEENNPRLCYYLVEPWRKETGREGDVRKAGASHEVS